MHVRKWLIGCAAGLGLAVAAVVVASGEFSGTAHAQSADTAGAASAAPAPVYAERGAETCVKCHDTDRMAVANAIILKGPHAMKGDSRTPFGAGNHECETCHGPSPQHTAKPPEGQKRAAPTVVFKGDRISPVAERNKVCIGCHESGLRMNWKGSQHEFNEVACSNCHSVHTVKDHVLIKKEQPEVCFQCHFEQRAQTFRPSHHPIREGKVVCSDCHNPHGSINHKSLTEATTNETCFKCHAEKRGPFLWEHESVRDDCTNCHNPHGSSQTRLLKEKPPWLCQECHAFSGHPSTLYNQTVGIGSSATAVRWYAKACLNCHVAIHGSNHPSGARLMR